MPKDGKFGGFSKEKRGFCQMVASAGWKTGWVEVEGGQNVVRALGWWQSVLGISNTAASTQIPTAALETRSCPITMDTTSLPKETCSWSATLRASRESLLRRGAVLRAIAQGRVWGWIIEDETTPTNSPPPVLLNGDTQAPQRRRCQNQTRPIVVGDVVTSPLLGSPTPSGLFLTSVG